MRPITDILTGPLTPWMGTLLLFAGVYSLLVNTRVEEEKNHRRGARAARWGGWLYLAAGAAVLWFAWVSSG